MRGLRRQDLCSRNPLCRSCQMGARSSAVGKARLTQRIASGLASSASIKYFSPPRSDYLDNYSLQVSHKRN